MFLTITISGPRGEGISPGDTDPAVPAQLAAANYIQLEVLGGLPNPDLPLMQALARNVQSYNLQTRGATRGSGRPWWRNISPSSNEMTYECDIGLGQPADVDCSQIEWHQLKSNIPSDTLTVGPQNPTSLHSSRCRQHPVVVIC